MKRIYFDNACTAFPKPRAVAEAVYQYMTQNGSNINRGCYGGAYQAEETVYETRRLLCDLFCGEDCRNVVFTKNATEGLNFLLKGFLSPGDHVITSSMEHNAVMRPLAQLEKQGVAFSRIPCDQDGRLPMDTLPGYLRPNTKALVMTHASNVCGTLLPVEAVGAFCREHGLVFFLDTAQTAGSQAIHMKEMNIDALAFTGHKGLLGPQGTGGFLLLDHLVSRIEPLLSGGTGSVSHTEELPDFMPDRFEPGTMNLPGIIGLKQGLLWLKETGLEAVREHELTLTKRFLQGLLELDGKERLLRIIGSQDIRERTGVVSLQILKQDMAQMAFELDETYGIMTRAGLHCAPSAHKTLGTFPTGTIRFSFGWWNTTEEVDFAISALKELLWTK